MGTSVSVVGLKGEEGHMRGRKRSAEDGGCHACGTGLDACKDGGSSSDARTGAVMRDGWLLWHSL